VFTGSPEKPFARRVNLNIHHLIRASSRESIKKMLYGNKHEPIRFSPNAMKAGE